MIFTLNVTESIQEKYGTIKVWSNLIQRDVEPDIKALKLFITEAFNEGLEIEAEKTGKKVTSITAKLAESYLKLTFQVHLARLSKLYLKVWK